MIRVNLLGLPKPKKRAPVVTLEGSRSLVLLVVVLVLVALVQFYRYGSLQAEETRLTMLIQDQQAEKVRLESIKIEVEKFTAQKELLLKRISIIEELKSKQSGPTRLLDMLGTTVAKTNTLWLTNFEQAGQNITIEGFALSTRAVADFLTNLKQSNAFTEVDLKETYQDINDKETPKFLFTVNGQLVATTPAT